MRKLIKNYLKDPLATIAINTTIFIMGCLFFGTLATIGIVSTFVTLAQPAQLVQFYSEAGELSYM